MDNWRQILWAEWSLCDDKDYARRLYEGCGPFDTPGPSILFSERPTIPEIELALYAACAARPGAKYIWEKRLHRIEQEKRKNTPVEKLIGNLTDHHWFARMAARHALVYRGGETVIHLETLAITAADGLRDTITRLLQSIGMETTTRLAPTLEVWLCPMCLLRCGAHHIDRSWQPDWTYYGCRFCRRSRDLLRVPGEVIARLDRQWWEPYLQDGETVISNWFGYQPTLFDFDAVEIIQASDEDVERFAMLVGNDTDSLRQPRYKGMSCVIDPACQLSKNSERILRSTFGQVRRGSNE